MTTHSPNSAISDSELNRPRTYWLECLMESLSPHLTYVTYEAGQRFASTNSRNHKCYFIRKGAISLYRQPEGFLFDLLEAPTLRGVMHTPEEVNRNYVVTAITSTEIAILELETFYTLLTEMQLWEFFARHLQYATDVASKEMFQLAQPSAYSMVRYQLYQLMSKSEAIRLTIPAENYIRSKTFCSRSAIMRILSDLKIGGYIELERGRLKAIHHIPEKY